MVECIDELSLIISHALSAISLISSIIRSVDDLSDESAEALTSLVGKQEAMPMQRYMHLVLTSQWVLRQLHSLQSGVA